MATVAFERVGKVYRDGTRALTDFDLEVADGEFMVFVGPSGCGKTTALRMVAGLEDISEGEIKLGSTVVNGLHPRKRDIAMVFQNYALYPHMTVYKNIAFALRVRKTPEAEIRERVETTAKILGLTPELQRKPAQLSGGQRQRVAMGRAIVRNPQVFLMDEPLSNLDAKLRVQMRAEIARIQREVGATTIYVTHDQIEAMTMGDRVAVLRKGALQQCDAPQVLYEHPVNLFVASFIGSPAMNLVQAQIEQDGDEARLRDRIAAARAARHAASRRLPALRGMSDERSRSARGRSTFRTQLSPVTAAREQGCFVVASSPLSCSAPRSSRTSRSKPRPSLPRKSSKSQATPTARSPRICAAMRASTGRPSSAAFRSRRRCGPATRRSCASRQTSSSSSTLKPRPRSAPAGSGRSRV